MTARRLILLSFALLFAPLLAGCATAPEEAPASTGQETKTFELRPGGSVEYKLQMREGATLDYQWSTSRPVNYDFHGDSGSDVFASHKKGTAIADQQAGWAAPFDGRHGWYWKNNHAQPVTITLTTEGDYTVVGIV